MRATAVVAGNDPAVVRGVGVRAATEHLAEHAAQRDEKPAAGAGRRGGPGQWRPRPVLAVVPALGGLITAGRGQYPGPAREGPLRDVQRPGRIGRFRRAVGVPVDYGVVPGQHHHGDEPFVVIVRGKQVTHADIAGLEPVAPGDPGGGQQRVRPRDEGAVVNGHVARARGTRDGHGPAPAGVSGIEAGEQVGDDPVAPRLHATMLSHLLGADDVGQRGTRQVDGLRAGLIRLFAADTDGAHD